MHRTFADKAVPPWIAEVKKHYGTEKTKYACVGCVPLVSSLRAQGIC